MLGTLFLKIYFIEVQLSYNAVLASGAQQSDSVIYVHIYSHIYTLFHYDLSQDIEYHSLCYTVGPCCLSILHIYTGLHLQIPKAQCISPPLPLSLATTSLFSMSMRLFLFRR